MLQGLAEIQLLWERLSVSRRFSGSASEWLIQLHSSVAPADQRRAFQRPPKGIRKVYSFYMYVLGVEKIERF